MGPWRGPSVYGRPGSPGLGTGTAPYQAMPERGTDRIDHNEGAAASQLRGTPDPMAVRALGERRLASVTYPAHGVPRRESGMISFGIGKNGSGL